MTKPNHIAKVKGIKFYPGEFCYVKIIIGNKEEMDMLKNCILSLENEEYDHIHIQSTREELEVTIDHEETYKKNTSEADQRCDKFYDKKCTMSIKKLNKLLEASAKPKRPSTK